MGGAVSSGRDNNELIDNLMTGNYIRSQGVERVFRALDRADFMTPETRDQAYKDLAWKNGPLHLSSPCTYSEVMEGLELSPGLSFLNIGSGTGYLSTLAGLILGTSGISHGVEVHPAVFEYAVMKVGQFRENSPVLDDFDFCVPKFFLGNGLCLSPNTAAYDRVYCGAGCLEEYQTYFKRLVKVGGILVMPVGDTFLKIRRVEENKWTSRNLLNVPTPPLRTPTDEEAAVPLKLDEQSPVQLQLLARAAVRRCMRLGVLRRHPELREAPRAPPPAVCPSRICIPIEPGSAVEGLNLLHDLDSESGGNEMNALLSLVISMGHNRLADALRFDRVDSSDSSDDDDNDNENGNEEEDNEEHETETEEQSDNNNQTEPRSDSSDHPRDTSDSDDTRPPRSRKRPDRPTRFELHKRLKRPHSEDPEDPRIPPGCRVVFSYKNKGETSTSNKEVQTSSEELDDLSEPRSSTSTDDSAHGSMGSTRPDLPGVPSEVEIDLGPKIAQEASTSHTEMEWEEARTEEDDAVEGKCKLKRRKLDSGIEEITPSTSSLDKSKSESESDQSERSAVDNASVLAGCGSPTRTPSRHAEAGGSEAADAEAEVEAEAGGSEEAEADVEECVRAHLARRRRRVARGGDARRVRLSLLMKQAVRELPLPHALKKFVNLGRCFEF